MNLFNQLERDFPTQSFEEGTVFLGSFKRINEIIILLNGTIVVHYVDETGQEYSPQHYHARECFGLIEYFHQESYYLAQLKAKSSVQVIRISKEDFTAYLSKHPELYPRIVEYLSSLVIRIMMDYQRKAFDKPKERMRAYFLDQKKKAHIKIVASKSELAQQFGISERSLYRYLKEFEEEGILERKKQSIYLR